MLFASTTMTARCRMRRPGYSNPVLFPKSKSGASDRKVMLSMPDLSAKVVWSSWVLVLMVTISRAGSASSLFSLNRWVCSSQTGVLSCGTMLRILTRPFSSSSCTMAWCVPPISVASGSGCPRTMFAGSAHAGPDSNNTRNRTGSVSTKRRTGEVFCCGERCNMGISFQ